ncbi:TRAP transporter small permease subunit [Algihabitans albus]|uniref:TRAP transporter small permease n=1 Tax=Algihabitans albus TaxID=2164067 RepID=UPI0035D029AD
MTKFVHVVDRANSGLRLLLVLGFAALALIGVAQVAARYLFGAPLVWSEEVIRYGLIWLVFAGAGVAARLQAFMAVEILIHATPRSLGRAIALAAGLIGIGVWIMLAVLGVRILSDLQGISVGALETPIVWLYLAVPVGAAWAAVNTLAALLAAPRMAESGR